MRKKQSRPTKLLWLGMEICQKEQTPPIARTRNSSLSCNEIMALG